MSTPMNTNEQKSLGQIACEADAHPNWDKASNHAHARFEHIASAVEAAALSRLGGEWLAITDGLTRDGDERYVFDASPWVKVPPGLPVSKWGFVRRRIIPSPAPEVHVATESAEKCHECGEAIHKRPLNPNCRTCFSRAASFAFPELSPQPPATPASETSTFWQDKCKYLEGVRDRQTEQLQQVTRERDEAQKKAKQWDNHERFRCEHCGSSEHQYSGPPDCPGCGAPNCCQNCCKMANLESRAEAAEKKLAEVEKEKNEAIHALQFRIEESETILGSVDKLKKQLSRLTWTPTSTRLPTKEDAIQTAIPGDWIFWSNADGPWVGYLEKAEFNGKPATHWMTPIPLPTPPEEDAAVKASWNTFVEWVKTTKFPPMTHNDLFSAFKAGRQSK